MELWKAIPGFNGKYEVSNYGKVKNTQRNRELKGSIGSGGYIRVDLMVDKIKHKNFRVHKLVAMAFLDHIPCGLHMTVDHIDFNKLNNHSDNLQLISLRDNNIKSAIKYKKTSLYLGVHYCSRTNRYVARIIKSKKKYYLGSFINEEHAAKRYQEMELKLYGKLTQTQL